MTLPARTSLPCLASVAALLALSGSPPDDAAASVAASRPAVSRGDLDARLAAMPGDVLIVTHEDGSIEIIDEPKMIPHLDIKPGSCPNPVNLDPNSAGAASISAVIAVSILGNAFDVTDVDIDSVRMVVADALGSEQVAPIQATYSDTGTPFIGKECQCHAAGGDGFLDLDLKFDRQAVIDAFELANIPFGEFLQLEVRGTARGGRDLFAARDCIRVQNHDEGE